MVMLAKIRRMHFRDGMSVREVSRHTGLSRKTVCRWLRQEAVEPAYPARKRPCIAMPTASGKENLSDTLVSEFSSAKNDLNRPCAINFRLMTNACSVQRPLSFGREEAFDTNRSSSLSRA